MSFLITQAYINMMNFLNLYPKILKVHKSIYQMMKFQLLTAPSENNLDIYDWCHRIILRMLRKGQLYFYTLSNKSNDTIGGPIHNSENRIHLQST